MKLFTYIVVFFTTIGLFAQSPNIDHYLEMVANGKLKEVKSQLPDLLVEYPNDPGVKLLLAVVIEDAYKALDLYKKIASDYPESKWADDAYWRIVQFYAVQGDTEKAKNELKFFRTKYPSSPYIIPAAEVVRISEGVFRENNKAVKTNKKEAIGRENNKIEVREEVPENPPLQDLTEEEKNEKIGYNEPVKEESKDKEAIEGVHSTDSSKDLAFNSGNHKVIRKKQEKAVEDKEDSESKKDSPSKEILEFQKNKINGSKKSTEELAENTEVAADTEDENDVTKKQTKDETFQNTGYYGLQVGVYESKETAESEMKKFLKKRMRTEVKPKNHENKEMYSVVIGNYSSLESAKAAKIIVEQQCDCEPVVMEK